MPKIISKRCEFVKLCLINRSSPVFLRHSVYLCFCVCSPDRLPEM